ncbi:SGNH/GDSL hydrolase family protein [Caulobacter sp. LARHSG274]
MMRMITLALAAAVATGAVAAPASPPAPLPVHVAGRVLPAADGSLGFGWPGVYFEGRFRGAGVEAAVESGTEFMRLLVDGEEKAQLRRPGLARLTLQGLPPGEHVVRLEKQTESQAGGGRFIGFYPTEGGQALPAVAPARRIEFIGDSYTVGYGNLSPVQACTDEQVHDLTDSQKAFGPVLARRLNADYRLVAFSGFGVVRNYNGTSPGQSLPAIYDRAVPGDPTHPLGPDGWRPQVVVINLGTNDFSTPLNPGEPWADQAALRAAYRDRYVAFARMLMARQPQARFVLMGSDAFYDLVSEVATTLNDPARIATVRFGGLAVTGCNYHPSLADHQAMADLLQGALARFPDAWSEGTAR